MNSNQIASRTSGYIVLRFETSDGTDIERKLSLPVEMAGQLQKIRVVPIRYQPGAFNEIVLMPTYETQKNLAWTNILMALVALLITFFIALTAHRFAKKKLNEKEEELVIERVDQ
ncbi:MAG: hypothetical protein U5J63_10960 [Fodinibius sp.]|nr:hypothetical protein [Fodinibius sp.]